MDDIGGAREEFAAADVELIGDLVWAAEGCGWFYFRAPDGNIYVMQQDVHPKPDGADHDHGVSAAGWDSVRECPPSHLSRG